MKKMGVNSDEILAKAHKAVGLLPQVSGVQGQNISNELKDILNKAAIEAGRLKDEYISNSLVHTLSVPTGTNEFLSISKNPYHLYSF